MTFFASVMPYSFTLASGLELEDELDELLELELEELELLLEELEEEELEEELLELELELLEELLLELEESLLEPPPPPPPQAVSIETVIAAASATAITFFANLMVNFLPHFQNRQRKSSFGPSVSLNLPPPVSICQVVLINLCYLIKSSLKLHQFDNKHRFSLSRHTRVLFNKEAAHPPQRRMCRFSIFFLSPSCRR